MAVGPEQWQTPQEAAEQYLKDAVRLLSTIRAIDEGTIHIKQHTSIPDAIRHLAKAFSTSQEHSHDADAFQQLLDKVTTASAFGGLGLGDDEIPTTCQYDELVFQTEAHLESVNSQLRTRNFLHTSNGSDRSTRPMTLAQKIFTQHAISGIPFGHNSLAVGDVIRAGVDWVIASELSWSSMASTHEELGSPGIWRNDRLWIAGDHVVHPSIADNPKIKFYIETAEKAKKDFKMTEFQGMNYTIMHTEFVRERAEPGMLVVGSDSHTCSAGAVGCLAIGLGAADVMMTCALGETWFKIPESVLIELQGHLGFAISGKDVILHILKELKRNTVAAERIVEFTGDGVQYLSCDARFAICNMCTEFGAITGIFPPDGITRQFIEKRKRKANRSNSLYFRPDPEAVYAEKRTIDLCAVEPSIAVYPDPDNVVPISAKAGMPLDGVFIGACTTTEEELVLAALVLKVGLTKNLPLAKGKRHYVPGSLPIVEKLRSLGLLEIYETAGFTRGPPGCSMCVGLTAEKAGEGEVWLSSQNRNFQNRMGKGAVGHLSSAVVCAASSFGMQVCDPKAFLEGIDREFWERYKGVGGSVMLEPEYVEPAPYQEADDRPMNTAILDHTRQEKESRPLPPITSKITLLGDFIDTDALSPGFTLTSCKTAEDFGKHVLCYTHPDFRQKVINGQQIIVAGHAFGVGSSRETAVLALRGVGVQAVIAKSFAFIYGRNQPSLGLLGIVIKEEEFYGCVEEGMECEIDVGRRRVRVGGREFRFELSEIEEKLIANEGITGAFARYGRGIWEGLTSGKEGARDEVDVGSEKKMDDRLEW